MKPIGAQTTITLELLLDGDGLSGRAVAGGTVREFSGRLGLMHAIDELLATPAGGPPQDNGAGNGAERNHDVD
jgi:hypothetical protein